MHTHTHHTHTHHVHTSYTHTHTSCTHIHTTHTHIMYTTHTHTHTHHVHTSCTHIHTHIMHTHTHHTHTHTVRINVHVMEFCLLCVCMFCLHERTYTHMPADVRALTYTHTYISTHIYIHTYRLCGIWPICVLVFMCVCVCVCVCVTRRPGLHSTRLRSHALAVSKIQNMGRGLSALVDHTGGGSKGPGKAISSDGVCVFAYVRRH